MSDPNKRWSWRATTGRATGSGVVAGAGAAVVGSIAGPGVSVVGAVLVGAFTFGGSVVSDALGHCLDDPFGGPQGFGSGALYGAVVGGTLFVVLAFLALNQLAAHPERLVTDLVAVGAFSGFLAGLSHSLLNDLRAAERMRG